MNKVREVWARGEAAVVGWLQIPGVYHAEMLAKLGFDALVVDLQHSPIDFADAAQMMGAIEAGGTEPFVRAQWNDPSTIMKLMDAGCYGVIAPMVNSGAEARAMASAVHYPPRGTRSWGPRRPAQRYPSNYMDVASSSVVSLAMVETREALEDLDGILKADIDGVFIGPTDLSLALGGPATGLSKDPKVVEAIRMVRERTHAAGKKAGIFTSSVAFTREKIAEGFDLVTTVPDFVMLAGAATSVLKEIRAKG